MQRLQTTYIGHATLLLEFPGVRVLTDPNFDPHLGLLLPRVTPPGVLLHHLPRLDAIVITHAHADHLSFRSLDQLDSSVPVFAPPPVARWLRRRGQRRVEALAPGESVQLGELRIAAEIARHAGARYGVDVWRGAANMYLFDDGISSCLFAGDTARSPGSTHLVETRLHEQGRRLDLALLPIGHAPWWKRAMFRRGHLTPADALDLFEALGARYMIPYHWGTFRHITAGAFDGIQQLRRDLHRFPRSNDVRILEPGMSFTLEHQSQ